MIAETIITMTILGCGDTTQNCDYINTKQHSWATEAACENAIPSVLESFKNSPYPTLTAECHVQVSVKKPDIAIAEVQDVEKNTFEKLQIKANDIDLDIGKHVKTQLNHLKDGSKAVIGRVAGIFRTDY